MTVVQTRGGVPRVIRDSVSTTGRRYSFPFYTFYLKARNKGANIVRMYFTEDDFTADANYVEIPVAAATDPYGQWEAPTELQAVWLKAITAATNVELVIFQRRG